MRGAMKFGSEVLLCRGGHERRGPGMYRWVRARLITARRFQVYCELLDDDPLSTVESKIAGGKGWWSRSIMFPKDMFDDSLPPWCPVRTFKFTYQCSKWSKDERGCERCEKARREISNEGLRVRNEQAD